MTSTRLESWLELAWVEPRAARPWVTLAYAQSLNGSLTARRGLPTAISGPESLGLTHRLRTMHDAILIGVGTLLADDPRLSVRLADGPQPQPVVLDSYLRTPPGARLLAHSRRPWLAARKDVDPGRRAALEQAGAEILVFQQDERGRVPLPALLAELKQRGVRSLMVEGGAGVLTAFLQAGLADALALTIAPLLLGGLPALEGPVRVRLIEPQLEPLGEDWIVWGRLG